MSITHPASPLKKSRRRFLTLREHWRWLMMLGLGSLIVLLLSFATLIIFLGQRHSLITLHESSARQTRAAVQLTLDTIRQNQDGIPTDEDAEITDPQELWQRVVSPSIGSEGYVYLVDESGTLLAADPDLSREQNPADFEVLQAAREDSPRVMLYQGLTGSWVVGRAEVIPNSGMTVITEIPLSEFTPVVIRTIALWIAALLLALLAGEWLIRRMSIPVLTPVEIIQEGARAIGDGNYRYIIRLPADTEREIAELGRAFNTIVARLQDGQKQIDAFTNQMEEIVDLRARELSRKAQRLEVAAEVSGKITTILDPRALIKEVEDLIRARFVVYHVEILLLDSQRGALTPGKNMVQPPILLSEHATSVLAWVARNGKTLYVPNVSEEPRYRRDPHLPASQSELAIPLRFGGRVIGVLNLESEHRQSFSKDDIAVLESLGTEIAVAIHNAQVFDALETANRDLAQATLQAKQANVLKSRFLLNASHKLRTPLNVIIGYSETILSGMYGAIPEKVADRQSRILENGRHLQALIEDMLDLSSIETGHMELSLEWVNLPPLLEEVMNATRALHQTGFAEHDLAIRLSMPASLPLIWADPNRLRYILISLMGNAVKFTNEGEIVMSAETHENTIQIHVQDTGPGIREDELTVLFEPFQHQRGSTASEGKGTGLGLPVSRLLALMHGGDLTVDSILHRGSTFTLTLPCRPEGAPPPPDRPGTP